MKIIKIKNGKILLVNERGMAVGGRGEFGRDIVSAFLNDKEELIVATTTSGKVELMNERGVLKRTIVNVGAVNARFAGEDIIVETKNGKLELRSQTGLLKKNL